MKPFIYTLIAVFAIGVTSAASATAQQGTGNVTPASTTAGQQPLNVTPVPLTPVSVVGAAAESHAPLPINRQPAMLKPVHIVAAPVSPSSANITLVTSRLRGARRAGMNAAELHVVLAIVSEPFTITGRHFSIAGIASE